MYLHLEEAAHTNYNLVLSCQDDDWGSWWPAKYCMLEHRVDDDKSQQWFWNEQTGAMHNAAYPQYTLDADKGWLMIADTKTKATDLSKGFPKTERKWWYDPEDHSLTTDMDGVKTDVAVYGSPQKWVWAQVAPHAKLANTNADNKFKVDYCYKVRG